MKLLKESNDGPLIAIVVEDFAATLGLIIALIGTLLTYVTTNSIYDAASSIMIGLLLMVSGLFLGYEMKHLITGETVDPNIYKNIKKISKFYSYKPFGKNSNPFTAIKKFLKSNKNFIINNEPFNKALISNCYSGFLKKIR